MYSFDDRIRAVELYVKLGKRSRATIRQLGYPTKNSLRNWYNEFLERGELHVSYKRSRQKYSAAQMAVAIDHYMNHGHCISATLKALGYPCRKTLTDWVRELYPESRKSIADKVIQPKTTLTSKRMAVYDFCTREGSALAVAQKLDVDRVTLYNWKNQLLGREVSESMKSDKHPVAGTDLSELERQVESLRHNIRNLNISKKWTMPIRDWKAALTRFTIEFGDRLAANN